MLKRIERIVQPKQTSPRHAMKMLLALMLLAVATAEVVINKEKKCTKFKCYGRKDMAPRSPYFAPRGNSACPEGASPHLATCCAERDACAGICGITEDACQKAFDACYARECEDVDDFDENAQCLKDGKIGSDWPWRGGCTFHAAQQKLSCRCEARKDAAARRKQVLEHVYKRYGGDASKVDELLIRADTPKLFAQLILRLAGKFPTLLSDTRPSAEPKPKKKAPPSEPAPPEEAPPPAEEDEVDGGDAAEEDEEDVIDLDEEGEL